MAASSFRRRIELGAHGHRLPSGSNRPDTSGRRCAANSSAAADRSARRRNSGSGHQRYLPGQEPGGGSRGRRRDEVADLWPGSLLAAACPCAASCPCLACHPTANPFSALVSAALRPASFMNALVRLPFTSCQCARCSFSALIENNPTSNIQDDDGIAAPSCPDRRCPSCGPSGQDRLPRSGRKDSSRDTGMLVLRCGELLLGCALSPCRSFDSAPNKQRAGQRLRVNVAVRRRLPVQRRRERTAHQHRVTLKVTHD